MSAVSYRLQMKVCYPVAIVTGVLQTEDRLHIKSRMIYHNHSATPTPICRVCSRFPCKNGEGVIHRVKDKHYFNYQCVNFVAIMPHQL